MKDGAMANLTARLLLLLLSWDIDDTLNWDQESIPQHVCKTNQHHSTLSVYNYLSKSCISKQLTLSLVYTYTTLILSTNITGRKKKKKPFDYLDGFYLKNRKMACDSLSQWEEKLNSHTQPPIVISKAMVVGLNIVSWYLIWVILKAYRKLMWGSICVVF